MSILCATDFSPRAQEAADIAVLLARKLSLPLRLIHCAHDYIVMGDLPVTVPDDKLLKDQLQAEAQRLRASGITVTEELRHGGVGWELLEAAREETTELIVLGSTGKGNAERWLIGSVAQAVAEEAPVPCLVVRRPEVLQAWLEGKLELEVLCAVDMAGSSDAALSWLSTLAAVGPAKIGATYVQTTEDEGMTAEQHQARERDVWEKVRAKLGSVPLDVYVSETKGRPAEEFLQLAQERRPGLMVVGSRHRHGLRQLLSRSFSHRVLAHAASNVLCVPARPEAAEEIPCIRRVLLATDLGPLAVDALRHAHSVLPYGGQIHMLHVCQEPSHGVNPVIASEVYFDHSVAAAKERAEAAQKLKELPARLLPRDAVKVTSEVVTHHDCAAAICAAADRMAADVICMGSRGHTRIGAALLGSTVQAVLARAQQPVFVIPSPRS